MIEPLYTLSGLVVGLLVGMTGVGGGSLMTPILVVLFGIHPAVAVGTDLLFAACTKTAGTLVHGITGTVEWRIVGLLALGSLPATSLTLLGLVQAGAPSEAVARLMSLVLGALLFATALSLVFRERILAWAVAHSGGRTVRHAALLTVLAGFVLGVAVSVSSVGAGAIGVTGLLLLYPRLPTARVVGSDIAHAVPLTLVAGMGHWMIGSVDLHLLASLVLGSVPGIVAGSIVAAHVSERLLRRTLAVVLVMAATRLVA